MRTTSLLLSGLGATLVFVLLNTQVASVAKFTPEATTKSAAYLIAEQTSASEVYIAAIDRPEIERRHKQIANNVLMSLPAKCRDTLQHFYVKYTKQKHRGLAGKSVMILDGTVPDKEFRSLFVHETAHNWDLGCLKGTKASGKSGFSDGDEPIYNDDPSLAFYRISWIASKTKRRGAASEDFVSGYAAWDMFEDFAESFAYFVLHNEEFLSRARTNEALARKYVYIRDVVFDGVVPEVAEGNTPFTGKVPWDITKLKYTWL